MEIHLPTKKPSHAAGWFRHWPFVLFSLVALVFVLAPWPLWQKAWAIGYGICAQRPSHTYFAADVPLPVEARMVGMFIGWLSTTLYIIMRGRGRAGRMVPAPLLLALLGLIGIMGVDGLNATFYDARLPHPYQPQNPLRLLTGLGCGIAFGVLLLPAFNMTLWHEYDLRPPLAGWTDLVMLLALQFPLALLVMAQLDIMLYPLALATMFGIIGTFLIINTVLVTYFMRREGTLQRWIDSAPLLAWALIFTAVQIGSLALLKWWLLSTTGAQLQ